MKKYLADLLVAMLLIVTLYFRHYLPFVILLWLPLLAWGLIHKPRFHLPNIALISLILLSLGAPILAPFDVMDKVTRPDILGADLLGRDHFSRLLLGNRNTVMIAFFGTTIAQIIGTLLGGLLALGPRLLKRTLDKLFQAWLSIPGIVYYYVGVALVEESGPVLLIIMLGLTLWPEPARMLEARITELRDTDFVHVARMGGPGPVHIFFKEILPNLRAVWLVSALVNFISAVLLESSLGFLGLGNSMGTPGLGHLIEFGTRHMDEYPMVLLASIGLQLAWVYTLRAFIKQLGSNSPPLSVA